MLLSRAERSVELDEGLFEFMVDRLERHHGARTLMCSLQGALQGALSGARLEGALLEGARELRQVREG